MKYSKDYFTGMKHLADAIKYGLNERQNYWITKANSAEHKNKSEEYFAVWRGLNEAKGFVLGTLTAQLEIKSDSEELETFFEEARGIEEEITSKQALTAINMLNIYCNDIPNNNCEDIKCNLYNWCVKQDSEQNNYIRGKTICLNEEQ